HPACDLIADPGTEVLAVADGEVIRVPDVGFAEYKSKGTAKHPPCHSITFALEVKHKEAGFIARYCEIARALPAGVALHKTVKAGQVIATVGRQCGGSMLHFEMYGNTSRVDALTDEENHKYLYVSRAAYRRRSDLLDPTPYLDTWAS